MNGSTMKIAGEDALRQNIAETKRYIEEHSGSSGHTIVNSSGTEMTARSKLKFIGADILDDSTNDTTTVQISSSFNAMIDITTPSSVLYGATITVKKDGSTVDTTSFSNAGEAEYIAHSLGRYTFECTYGGNTYSSGEVVVVAQTLYETVIRAGLDLSSWITAGSTTEYPLNPSLYADFSALEADEAAIRQLMTVHASVDYLAQATAGDSLMESVIGSDVCAKWINISDYAYDTLSANADIKSVMDTADKYGYGEWGIVDSTTTPPTWGPLGNVPIMTANNAPYGEVITSSGNDTSYPAWHAFDGTDSLVGWKSSVTASTAYIIYKSVNPICAKRVKVAAQTKNNISKLIQYEISGSNDGVNYTLIYTGDHSTAEVKGTKAVQEADMDSNDDFYLYYKFRIVTSAGEIYYCNIITLQFYGRELTVKQASAPTDGRKYIKIGSNYYTEDWGEKEFATGSTRKTIYDHGVEPSGAITGGTKNPDCLTLSAVGTATVTINKGTRTHMGGKVGLHASGTNRLKCGSGYSAFTASNMPDSNGFDISSISGSVAVGIEQTASGTFDCTEIWIE